MALLNDILSWANADLTPWQRDALRRLFERAELSVDDYNDLYAMLKSARGLPDDKKRQPVPLSQAHLPKQTAQGDSIVLRCLRDLKHVNRIAAAQRLTVCAKGLTIVYGGNGSGKSGYARVLKRACRARDLSEQVHPNAFDPAATACVPEAVFDIDVGKQSISTTWKRDDPAPTELSSIAVFDGKCARAYLDDEQDVAYLPYGLDIVESLGQRVLPELSRRLTAELATINTDVTPFADLAGDTPVGKAIRTLSAATDPKSITAFATLTADETARLAELDKTLAEQDPSAKAKSLRQSAQRIDGLIGRIDTAVAWIADSAIQKLKSIDSEAETALAASLVAASTLRASDSLLPGTGEDVWKALFSSARSFAVGHAYPGEPFPKTDDEAKCVLCQQKLNADAAERMRRFESYVQQDTAKSAAQKEEQRKAVTQRITNAQLTFGLDDALISEIESLDPNVLKVTRELQSMAEQRRLWMLGALKNHDWSTPPALDLDARAELKRLSTGQTAQAAEFDKAADQAKKKLLETERADLRARVNLSGRLKAVLELVDRMKLHAALTKCKEDLKTNAISRKAKEFASQAVTAALKNGLDSEFASLGVGRIKTKLIERVEQGKMKHKLVLDLPVNRPLDQILSEGEQRAIAIGSFLAELRLAGHNGGIVFDDPVSSLDHHRRRDVARRLASEAKHRQVIILTHDTVFLAELRQELELQGVDSAFHHVEWDGSFAGRIIEGLPWEHLPYADRLDKLEKAQRELEKRWSDYPNEEQRAEMEHLYARLRAVIERVIQDLVFSDVIHRYRDHVKVGRLGEVVGFQASECAEIQRLHKICCDVDPSHDPSSAKNAPVPTASQLGQDIAALRTAVDAIRARRKGATSVSGSAPPVSSTSKPHAPTQLAS